MQGSTLSDNLSTSHFAVITFLHAVAPVRISNIHPVNATVDEGAAAIFRVEALGDSLTYQWLKDGSSLIDTSGKLEGVNTSELRILDVQTGDEGFYSCRVSNGAGDSKMSDPAYLRTTGVYCNN